MTAAPGTKRKEREIQRACMDVFAAHGIFVYPLQRERAGYKRASHIGFKGCPDIGGFLLDGSGRAFFCEVKRPGERPTLDQVVAAKFMVRHKVLWCLVHSVEEAEQAAKAIARPQAPGDGGVGCDRR